MFTGENRDRTGSIDTPSFAIVSANVASNCCMCGASTGPTYFDFEQVQRQAKVGLEQEIKDLAQLLRWVVEQEARRGATTADRPNAIEDWA